MTYTCFFISNTFVTSDMFKMLFGTKFEPCAVYKHAAYKRKNEPTCEQIAVYICG